MKEKLNAIGLETSGTHLSFAFLRKGKVQGGFHGAVALKHQQIFWARFPRLMAKAGLSFKAIDFMAVTRGPGRFKGVRFGLGIAAAWSKALHIPVFCPLTTELLYWQSDMKDWRPRNLLIPNAEALLRFALTEKKKCWFFPPHVPRAVYLKDPWT